MTKKPFQLSPPEPLTTALDELIAEKRRRLVLTSRECNRQTETCAALTRFIEQERAALEKVEPPSRIV